MYNAGMYGRAQAMRKEGKAPAGVVVPCFLCFWVYAFMYFWFESLESFVADMQDTWLHQPGNVFYGDGHLFRPRQDLA